MSNINDYIKWRGDLSFESSSFNSIDDMILARFSYMPFHKINFNKTESVESIAKKLSKFKDTQFSYHGDKELIYLMGKSNRFRNLKVTDFVSNTNKQSEEQFAAITIHLDNDTMYISFNGTDDSLIGWKEDFNLSFMKNIPSQLAGKNYLINQSNNYNKKIRIGGHSKGGNISIYSGISVNSSIQDRILTIKNYDGPGFSEDVVNSSNYNNLLNKITSYIPQSSIIGRILEHKEPTIIIKSIEKGIYQHDIFSWQVLGTDVVKIDKVTNDSEFIDKTISTWLKETSLEQRRIFIDVIFELFDSTNVNTFKEFSESKMKNINTLLKTYNNISNDEKTIIRKMIGQFFISAKSSLFEIWKNK